MKRIVLAALVIAALVGGGLYWQHSSSTAQKSAQAKGPPPLEVTVKKISVGPVTIYDEYVGQTDAQDVIEIRAQVTGLLEHLAFADGAHVRKGELLYKIDPRPFESALAQAKANLAQAQATLINARQRLERTKLLLDRKFVSGQDYDAAVAAEQSGKAGVEAQQALVRAAELNLGFTVIRAPREGFISKSLVKSGALITAQQTLLNTLYSSDPIYIYFSVSESKLQELTKLLSRPAGEESEKAPAFRIRLVDGTEFGYPGRLNFLDAALDEKTGTLRARLLAPNPGRLLRPGQFVRVIVPVSENPSAIRVPQKAVRELQGMKTVFIVDRDNKVAARPINARHRIGSDWVVDSGLASGDVVVIEGTQKVRPGLAVKPVTADAAVSVGAGPGTAKK